MMAKRLPIPSAKLRALVSRWEDDKSGPMTDGEIRAYKEGLVDSLSYWTELLKK